jgi:hypothetical protein
MPNFVLAYTGGNQPQGDAEREASMQAWGAWFGQIGSSVVDAGNPFAGSSTVASSGAVSNGNASGLTGYTVVTAADMNGAVAIAKGCPHLQVGGAVEVHEIFPIM